MRTEQLEVMRHWRGSAVGMRKLGPCAAGACGSQVAGVVRDRGSGDRGWPGEETSYQVSWLFPPTGGSQLPALGTCWLNCRKKAVHAGGGVVMREDRAIVEVAPVESGGAPGRVSGEGHVFRGL